MNKLSSVIRSILILVTTGLINPAFADQHSATGIAYSDVVSKITSSYKELCKKTILDEAYVLNIDETAEEVLAKDSFFKINEDAIYTVNLVGGDFVPTVVNPSNLGCYDADHFRGWCGSGGCISHVIVDGYVYDIFGSEPEFIQNSDGNIIMIVYQSGSVCSGSLANSAPCAEAYVYDAGAQRLNHPNLSGMPGSDFNE